MGTANEPFLFHLFFSELILGAAVYLIFYGDLWLLASRILALFGLALCVLFPFWLTFPLLVLGMYGNHFLRKVNLYKISKNAMPITFLDLAITVRNPTVLFYMFDPTRKWLSPLIWGLFLIGVGIISELFVSLKVRSQGELSYFVIVLCSFLVVFFYFKHRLFVDVCNHFSQQYPFGMDARNHMGWTLGNWEFDSISKLSLHLGMPAFLIYTHTLAKKEIPEFFKKTKIQRALPANDLVKAAKRYLPSLPGQKRGFLYPNIVVMQAESIFDPARAFILSNNYRSSIFTENKYTKCLCPLRVNIVGGGSWVSEFEFLTGLDTRLFGYIGYYSHVTLAPQVRGAFPTFLGALGYVTKAFYPATGKFYNADKAYPQYGFMEFLDSRALNLPKEWASSDLDLAHAFLQRTQELGVKPFFSFIVTNGAHSPYNRDNFLKPSQWNTSFQLDCDPLMNASLNEYIRLLGQTEEAIQLILERLVQIESQTGRPFVFLVYGDHQPYEFTEVRDGEYNYDLMRSTSPKNQTFVHVMSSIDNFVMDFKEELPLTLLPSVLSAAAVGYHQDLYALPNFYLYEKNGANVFPGLNAPSHLGVKSRQDSAKHYISVENIQAIAALKWLNIMRPI